MSQLEAIITDSIAASGPMAFSEFMELALYHDDFGFYSVAGQAGGRDGDFVTSVETGPLFAAVIGEWLDRRWVELGQPDPFRVVEAGAGVGTLWRGIRKAEPACFEALQWQFVERSDRLRDRHGELPPGAWSSMAQLPAGPVNVVLANELLDNLVFDVAERTPDGWRPVHVGASNVGGFEFVVIDTPLPDAAVSAGLDELGSDVDVGTRLPMLVEAHRWVREATSIADHVLAFDYGAPLAELARRDGQWLRTYRNHARGSDPLVGIGLGDITCDIAPELLPRPQRVAHQADWLRENGLVTLVEKAERIWRERGHIGDLEAMFARSAINESAALTDPSGLGGFLVIEW